MLRAAQQARVLQEFKESCMRRSSEGPGCHPEGSPSSRGTPMSRKVIMTASPKPMEPSSLQIENPNSLSLQRRGLSGA